MTAAECKTQIPVTPAEPVTTAGDLQAAQEWARREAAKIPPMTAGQVRRLALEARRADARQVPAS